MPVEVNAGKSKTKSLNSVLKKEEIRFGYKLADPDAPFRAFGHRKAPFGACELGRKYGVGLQTAVIIASGILPAVL